MTGHPRFVPALFRLRFGRLRFAGWILVGALFVAGLTCATANPETITSKYWVERFEARYRSAKSSDATFLEQYIDNGRLTRTEAGTAYFLRPGKMRWDYESPEKHLFLVDGKIAWFYVPEDHTVTRVPARQSTDLRTPLALLAGEMKVSKVCSRVEIETAEKPQSEQDVMLRCSLRGSDPSSAAQDDVVFFEIVRTTGDLSRLVVQQADGVRVELRFENWRINPPLSNGMFRFDVPPGVAIVNGELPAGNTSVK
jgi:outer membrane lipoprotein carrier protein